MGDPPEILEGWIPAPGFDAAQIGPMDTRRLSEGLLRQFATMAQLADASRKIAGNLLFGLQAPIMVGCRLLVHRIWVTIRTVNPPRDTLRCALFGGSHIRPSGIFRAAGKTLGGHSGWSSWAGNGPDGIQDQPSIRFIASMISPESDSPFQCRSNAARFSPTHINSRSISCSLRRGLWPFLITRTVGRIATESNCS